MNLQLLLQEIQLLMLYIGFLNRIDKDEYHKKLEYFLNTIYHLIGLIKILF